jgi:hypothetical protein
VTKKNDEDVFSSFRFDNALSIHSRTGEVRRGGKLVGMCDNEGNITPLDTGSKTQPDGEK